MTCAGVDNCASSCVVLCLLFGGGAGGSIGAEGRGRAVWRVPGGSRKRPEVEHCDGTRCAVFILCQHVENAGLFPPARGMHIVLLPFLVRVVHKLGRVSQQPAIDLPL